MFQSQFVGLLLLKFLHFPPVSVLAEISILAFTFLYHYIRCLQKNLLSTQNEVTKFDQTHFPGSPQPTLTLVCINCL